MKRGYLNRKTRLKSRGRSRFPKRRNPELLEYIRKQPCDIHTYNLDYDTCRGPTEAAHVKSRGAGGDDEDNTVPLCHRHHAIQHNVGIKTFQDMYDYDMAASARRHTEAWRNAQKRGLA